MNDSLQELSARVGYDTLPRVNSLAEDVRSAARSVDRAADTFSTNPRSVLFGAPAAAPGSWRVGLLPGPLPARRTESTGLKKGRISCHARFTDCCPRAPLRRCCSRSACWLRAALGTPAAISDIRYDFGPPGPAASVGTLPAVKVLEVTAPPVLESDRLMYRLSYADAQQTASYANSHWTMMPSQLLTQRLRGALSSHGTVLTGADGVRAPVLKVDLSEFEQVFDSQTESHAAITARATLTQKAR